MIKFFRTIRQKLISQNRFSKYLIYAIGEIILVVIGILIALQINNANTFHKETQTLHGYLNNIKTNIASDRLEIKRMITFRDSVKFYSRKIIQLNKKEKITMADIQLVAHDDYNIFYDQFLEINPSGFDALKSAGYLGMIQGTEIEKLLNDYYLQFNYIKNQEKSLNDFIENMEVLGFEERNFLKLIQILEKKNAESYVDRHQIEMREIIGHPSIQGANLRGSMVKNLSEKYLKLIEAGEKITKEIDEILKMKS